MTVCCSVVCCSMLQRGVLQCPSLTRQCVCACMYVLPHTDTKTHNQIHAPNYPPPTPPPKCNVQNGGGGAADSVRAATCCSVLQYATVCCSVLQCATACCSVARGGRGVDAHSEIVTVSLGERVCAGQHCHRRDKVWCTLAFAFPLLTYAPASTSSPNPAL